MNSHREDAKIAKYGKKNIFPRLNTKKRSVLSFFAAFASSRLRVKYVFLFPLLFLVGCASQQVSKQQISEEDAATQLLLAQAANEFQAPNAPKEMNLLDEADVEWHSDKSMKITVHQIWAARMKPDRPLPPLATLNQDSETLTVQTLKMFNLDEKGGFVPSPDPVKLTWTPPEANLPLTLSQIKTAKLPELDAGQALEIRYTLETKTATLLVGKDIHKDPKDAQKPHPIAPEGSFAFLWNDFIPSLKRDLIIQIPKDMELYGTRLRMPQNLSIEEDKTSQKIKTIHFSMGPEDPIPSESFQPAPQDLSPLTAFTLSKSWEEAVLPYRKRVKQLTEGDMVKINELIGDAGSNTGEALIDRVTAIKNAVHQKVDWVDTGLPVYLNPDRNLEEIVDSGKGTSHDMAVLLVAALRNVKINSEVFLYRQSISGDLLTDMPALSQFDGVLVAVQATNKEWIWMDPTEPLAAPGVLPLSALDRQALAVPSPVKWKTTPPFGAKDHRRHRDVTMEFDAQGNLNCSVDLLAYGSSELALRQFFRVTTGDRRREVVLKGLSRRFRDPVLTDYHFGDYHDLTKPLDVHYTFTVANYAKFTKDGGFSFYPAVFEDVEDFFAALEDNRKTPVVVPQNFNSETQAIVKLPDGFKPGELPKDFSISNPVAEFSSTAKVSFATLSYERYLGLKQRTISLGKDYQDLLAFYQAVLTQDRTPLKAVPIQ